MELYDFVERFFAEPKDAYDELPLREVCRDEDCGIAEVHRKHDVQVGGTKRVRTRVNLVRSRTVPCSSCLGSGRYEDGTRCGLCLGTAVIPRITRRVKEEVAMDVGTRCTHCGSGKTRRVTNRSDTWWYCGSCDRGFGFKFGSAQNVLPTRIETVKAPTAPSLTGPVLSPPRLGPYSNGANGVAKPNGVSTRNPTRRGKK